MYGELQKIGTPLSNARKLLSEQGGDVSAFLVLLGNWIAILTDELVTGTLTSP